MFSWLWPQDVITPRDTDRGMKMLLYDVVSSQAMVVLTLGPFMVAFAVSLGASNAVIGLIGAIGPLSQIIQLPSVYLVEHVRARKALTLLSGLLLRLCWVGVATIPLWVPAGSRIPAFLGMLVVYFSLSTLCNCAFVSWIRDVIPEEVMGTFFGKRMAAATAISAVISLAGAAGIDTYKAFFPNETDAYAMLFLVGAVCGLIGLNFLARVPEPRMHSSIEHGFAKLLIEPFRDVNYRALNLFLALWVFATNFSGPFFTVYMLKRLDFSMTWILGLSVVSQLMNVFALRIWGRLADRYNNKSIMVVTGPVFMLCMLLWPLMSMTEGMATLAFAVLFHAITGIASAGMAVGASNLTLLGAPKGRATAYLSVNALCQGVAASIAPIIAGLVADAMTNQHMSITFQWLSDGLHPVQFAFPALELQGLDFVFVFSVVFGLYAIHRLLAVHEEGGAARKEVQREFFSELERTAVKVSTIAGLRTFTSYAANIFAKVSRRDNGVGRETATPAVSDGNVSEPCAASDENPS